MYVYVYLQNVVQLEHLKTKFLPVAVCYAFSLVLSNKAYIYLSVSYLQVRAYIYMYACMYVQASHGRGYYQAI